MQSESINEIAGALAKARASFGHIEKTAEVSVRMKTGGQYKFSYAPLDEILKKIVGPLSENGIAFFQSISSNGGNNKIKTRVIHSSGQWFETSFPFGSMPHQAQELGGLITYMKRYSICMTFGIQADDDNDANEVSEKTDSFQVKENKKVQTPIKKEAPKPKDNLGHPQVRLELIEEIKGCLTTLTAGMETAQKIEFMEVYLKVKSFNDLLAQPIEALRNHKNELNDMISKKFDDKGKEKKSVKTNKFKMTD